MKRRPRPSSVILALGLALLPWSIDRSLRVNTTPSLPEGVYLLTERPLRRGTVVLACLPAEIGRYGRSRGYLSAGRCPGGAVPVLKRIAALPGDVVAVGERGLTVNGRPLAGTSRRSRDRAGRPLPSLAAGRYRVAPGQVWLYSNRVETSWDSRYWGAVPVAGVEATALLVVPLR